jgi:XRE family transcriptional regulator, regulator of sulfur utilization
VVESGTSDIGALEDPAGVGPRVRALRQARGMSLSELARRAALGKATLSGLEAGTRNPTLDTLHAIAAALGLPITALVATGGPARLRGSAVEIEVVRTFADDRVTYELCRMRIPAGSSQQSPPHHAGVTEHAMVFAGVLEAGPVDAPVRAAAGEHADWAADVRHGYAAIGDTDVLASLVIRSPHPESQHL